jgi:hypothetical protein
MITFYFVCKNGAHDNPTNDQTEVKFEVNTDYYEGLKMFRCIENIFNDWIRMSKLLGRTRE